MTPNDPVWVHCTHTGCRARLAIHWRHLNNFEGRYRCPDHTERSD